MSLVVILPAGCGDWLGLEEAFEGLCLFECPLPGNPSPPGPPPPPPPPEGTGYSIQDLGALGGSWSVARAINGAGDVVGHAETSAGETHAFFWSATAGAMQDLGTLGGSVSEARAIDDVGRVVGFSETSSGAVHAFLWTRELGMRDLGSLGGDFSRAYAINRDGLIVGTSSLADGAWRAFSWTSSEGMRSLGTLPGGNHSEALAVSDLGWVAGLSESAGGAWHAVLWRDGRIEDLGLLSGYAHGFGINEAGTVVGQSGDRAFRWTAATGMQDLGVLEGSWSLAWDVDNVERVVGKTNAGLRGDRAFIWTAGQGMRSLGVLPGRNNSEAYAINDAGRIVGWAANTDDPPDFRAVVWTPDTP